MATTKPRFSITVSPATYEAINTYQHEHRLATQTKAILELIELGIASLDSKTNSVSLAPKGLDAADRDLLSAYHSADDKSRSMVDLALADYLPSAKSKMVG